jgi:hypothetical protein
MTATVVSRGLSVDTDAGPADEVVARRLLDGHPTPHTDADVALAHALATGGPTRAARNLAAALGVDEKTARRGIDRARAAARANSHRDTAADLPGYGQSLDGFPAI